jgi:xanthine dehydrogenase molybdopterin binding subunit/xanthine dehydrogenase small subunit
MSGAIQITVNGRPYVVSGEAVHRSLLHWLRGRGLTGTKEGCAEGDCGACTVALVERRADGAPTYRAVNSCIALLPMFDGREVLTVEGLAKSDPPLSLADLHPVQAAMVECYGSQCGYCTPGFVVSMFEAYSRPELGPDSAREIADQLSGNLCRCTGYRPIRDAMALALERRKDAGEDLLQLRLKKPVAPLGPVAYEGGGERFERPASLEDLLRVKAERRGEAVLVGGATEIGVEINKKARRFPLLVSTEAVAELRRVRRTDAGWSIGGAATLTEVEEALGGAIPALDKMLWVFASRQIRSRATVAGNLVTASPIGDLAPVLLALGASVVLSRWDTAKGARADRVVPLDAFFLGYRKTVLAEDEVLTEILVPAAPATGRRLVDSFKVSKRRELDISIVAAAFCVDLDQGDVVTAARLAYGGVAATPLRAKRTEAVLVGKRWGDEGTLRAALGVLGTEASPISDVRSGAEFRKGLVPSLFEKFFRGERTEAQDEPLRFLRGAKTPPGDASRSLHHESAIGHVTGSAIYVDDEAHRRGAMLELWPVMAPHARARVLRRDATRARSMPGVVTVLFAEDVPGLNDVGAVRHDEPLLAKDEVLFHGQMVAVVVGESYEACRAAAAAVEVEYEPLPAVLSLEQAIAEGSFHATGPDARYPGPVDPQRIGHHMRRGDVAAALAASKHRLSGSLVLGGQEHFYLEAHAAWAERGDDGDVTVVSSTQHPSEIQTVVAHVLGLPRNKVVVQSPRMGGGFGGKETQGNGWAALVALAAWKTGRPVRVQLDRDVDMKLTGKRHPFRADWEVGFDDDGRIRGVYCEIVADGGWALDLSESICDRALFHFDNAYYLPNVHVWGRVAKTNMVSHTAFRGFGGPQGMVFIEDVMDRVARTLGLPPEVVRERNFYRGSGETATTHYGQDVGDARVGRMWTRLLASSEFAKRRAEVDAFNRSNVHRKRGLAITPVKFGISFTATFLNQAGALVNLYRDGTVQVSHGGTEMGQGLYTKIRGIAMRELGLPASAVRVMKTSTDKVPNTSATAASSGADLNGAAVRAACETLKARLAPIAANMIERKWGVTVPVPSMAFEDGHVLSRERPELRVPLHDVCDRAHLEQVSMSAVGYYRTPGIGYDKAAGKGKPFYYYAWGVAAAEVELDARSGMKRVRRVDVLHDVGDSLNPAIDRGQIEGAFVQGMGWLTGEELSWDEKGRLLTHSASTYQIPAISDAPFDFRVELLPDAAQEGTIHGSKAVGEPPFMLAISVREALRDAVAAFGAPGGIVELPSPATHEALWHAIQRRLRAHPSGVSIAAEE